MQEQLLPFEQPPASELKPRRRHKRSVEGRSVAEASIETYARVKNGRSKLYKPILQLLAECGTRPEQCPTARQILRSLKESGALPHSAERNNVSPRLTELLEAGCVEQPDYLKQVYGEAAAGVWRITDKGRDLLPKGSL